MAGPELQSLVALFAGMACVLTVGVLVCGLILLLAVAIYNRLTRAADSRPAIEPPSLAKAAGIVFLSWIATWVSNWIVLIGVGLGGNRAGANPILVMVAIQLISFAASILMALPVTAFAILGQRAMISGLTAGAVKG